MLYPHLHGGNHTDIKMHNISAILMHLLKEDIVSRSQLANTIGISSATVTNLVNELVDKKILVEEGQIKSGVGRPQTALRIAPESRYAIGIHLDVDSIHITLTNIFAQPIDHISIPEIRTMSWQQVLESAAEAAGSLIQRHAVSPEHMIGTGMSASGLVDPFSGINVIAPSMGWQNVPLRSFLQDQLQMPVVVDNNVRAMALFEALFGAAKHVQSMVFVYARMGVGAGLVVNRQLFHGATSGAGEIGHTTMIYENGAICRCGKSGCLETLFSEPALLEAAQAIVDLQPDGVLASYFATTDTPTLNNIFQAAINGDIQTQNMLTERVQYVGYALSNLINLVNPEMILLGGIFSEEHNTLIPTLQNMIRKHTFGTLGEQVELQPTTRGRAIGMQGAASLALDNLFYRQMTHFT